MLLEFQSCNRAEIARASSQNGTESRDRLDTLIYDTVMHNRHCLMGALLCFCFLSLCSRSSPLRYFQLRKNPAASTGPPEYIRMVGISASQTNSKRVPQSSQTPAKNGLLGRSDSGQYRTFDTFFFFILLIAKKYEITVSGHFRVLTKKLMKVRNLLIFGLVCTCQNRL